MNKRLGSFITALVAAMTVCSIMSATPAMAVVRTTADPAAGGHGVQVEWAASELNKDGSVTTEAMQKLTKSNYANGTYGNASDAKIIADFKDVGLTEADFYALKAQKDAGTLQKSGPIQQPTQPAMRYGWAKATAGGWYYSDNGTNWFTQGWKQIGGTWYYFYSSGIMAHNTVIDNYSLDSSGAWFE